MVGKGLSSEIQLSGSKFGKERGRKAPKEREGKKSFLSQTLSTTRNKGKNKERRRRKRKKLQQASIKEKLQKGQQ